MNAYQLADKINDGSDTGTEPIIVRIEGVDYRAYNTLVEDHPSLGKVIVVFATKLPA